MRIATLVTIALALVLALPGTGHAIPHLINYQGMLTDDVGDPIIDETIVDFTIWDLDIGGNALWTEEQSVFPDADGLFEILLGEGTPIPDSVFNLDDVYLGITLPPDDEMTPRTQLVAVAYSYRTGTVDGAAGGEITSKVTIGSGNTNAGAQAFAVGENNTADGDWSTVGGGENNEASGIDAVVSGGSGNVASLLGATAGGGTGNTAGAITATVGGGNNNSVTEESSVIGGGTNNDVSGRYAVIAGGSDNQVPALNAAVCGGGLNQATGIAAFVGGGIDNSAENHHATVAGGEFNHAYGEHATVPGGGSNDASGAYSFAAGRRAKALDDGSFVWGDNTDDDIESAGPNQFVVRASGGVWLGVDNAADVPAGDFLNTSTGAHLTAGGAWTNSSDVNKKENVTPVNREALLRKIADLPVTEWNYKSEGPSVRHIGPMAQDFSTLFQLGTDNTSISTIDPAGIALAAIQQLIEQNKEMEAEITELKAFVGALSGQKGAASGDQRSAPN